MNSQFTSLIESLNEFNLRYWIDSGTLLGIVRGGSLLEHDHDIDIGCYYEDIASLDKLISFLRQKCYKVKQEIYGDMATKLYCIPKKEKYSLGIDISFFYKHDKWAWKPTRSSSLKISPCTGSFIVHLYRQWLYLTSYKLQSLFISKDKPIPPFNWPFNIIYNRRGTWISPRRYYDSLDEVKIQDLEIPVPHDYKSYLKFRYDSWREEKQEWDYWYDDKAPNHIKPETFLSWEAEHYKKIPVKNERPSPENFISLPENIKRWLIVKTSGRTYKELSPVLKSSTKVEIADVLHMNEPGQETEPSLPESENITFPGERFTPSQLTDDFLKKLEEKNYDGALLLYNNLMDSSYRPAEKAFAKIPANIKYGLDPDGHLIDYNSTRFRTLLTTRKFLNLFRPLLIHILNYYLKITA